MKKQNLNNAKTQVLNISVIIERLKKLQKWHPCAGCYYDTPAIDWEKDNDGYWIKVEDIESLINEINQALTISAVVWRGEQLVCEHPDEAIVRDKPTDYCLACNRNI